MGTYVTWDVYDNQPIPDSRLSKVHYSEEDISKTELKYRPRRIKFLCGKELSLLIQARSVKSFLRRPCKRCKAIYTIRHTPTMEGYHTVLEKV